MSTHSQWCGGFTPPDGEPDGETGVKNAGLTLELKRRAFDESRVRRDGDGQFADVPGVGNDAPASNSRFATRADDARRSQGQTRSNFVHPATGAPMGKTETGDTYEALFEAKGAPLLENRYGGKYEAIAVTGGWLSRNTPLDFKVGEHGGELKSLSINSLNQKTAIKKEEIERKQKAVADAGLKPLLVVQVIDQDAGKVQVYGFEEFASKAVKKMEHLGEYDYTLGDFEAAQMKSGHHDKREARAAGKSADTAKTEEFAPGDFVIQLIDGVPHVYTQPDK